MGPRKEEFVGAPCGQHGPYTFYKAFKYLKEEKCNILSLGEFFFLKILDLPVCIGELQLLWEDKNDFQLLSSVRLYFLPQNTPEGKQGYHGNDEILALYEKLVLKVEDLVSLLVDNVAWTGGHQALADSDVDTEESDSDLNKTFAVNNSVLELADIHKERMLLGAHKDNTSSDVIIMSYARYCRYRAVLKRLENCTDKWLKKAIISAIGGFTAKDRNNRVMFCRDTFYHPDLEDLEIRCDHLAPNLKGRPRKKKLQLKRETSVDSDSNGSASDMSTPPPIPSPYKMGKRVSALRNGLKLDKGSVSKEEQSFLIGLHKFMRNRQTPIERIPSLGFKQIDLYYFYSHAKKIGGYEQVTQKRCWKRLYDQLGGHPGSTSAATCTRRHYERLLLPYERHLNGEEHKPLPTLKKRRASQLMESKPKKLEQRQSRKENTDIAPKVEKETENHIVETVKKKILGEVTLTEKEKKWDEIRRTKAMERDKVRKSNSSQRTVRALLDTEDKKDTAIMDKIDTVTHKDPSAKLKHSKDLTLVPKTEPEDTEIQIQEKSVDSLQEKTDSDPSDKIRTDKTEPRSDQPIVNPPMAVMQGHPPVFYSSPFAIQPYSIPMMASLPMHMQPMINDKHFKPAMQQAVPLSQVSTATSDAINPPVQRPSVIQHTPTNLIPSNPIHSHQIPSSYSLPLSHPQSSSPQEAHKTLSAANGLKRCYPYETANGLVTNSHISPAHTNSPQRDILRDPLAASPYIENLKRQRVEKSPESQVLRSQNFVHSSSHVQNSSMNCVAPVHSSEEDQPQDFSMKTLRQLEAAHSRSREELRNVSHKENQSLTRVLPVCDYSMEGPQDLSVKSRSGNSQDLANICQPSTAQVSVAQGTMNRTFSTSVTSFNPTLSSVRAHTTPSPRICDLDLSNRQLCDRANNNFTKISDPSKPSIPQLDNMTSHLHPAFPQHFVRSHLVPSRLFPTQFPVSQLYRAQLQANVAQASTYNGLARRDMYGATPSQMFLPTQTAVYSGLHTETQKHPSHTQ